MTTRSVARVDSVHVSVASANMLVGKRLEELKEEIKGKGAVKLMEREHKLMAVEFTKKGTKQKWDAMYTCRMKQMDLTLGEKRGSEDEDEGGEDGDNLPMSSFTTTHLFGDLPCHRLYLLFISTCGAAADACGSYLFQAVKWLKYRPDKIVALQFEFYTRIMNMGKLVCLLRASDQFYSTNCAVAQPI